MSCTARLTPAMALSCTGSIHSVFPHAVNAMMTLPGGETRLLTLTGPDAPRLPDSVCIPAFSHLAFETGMPVCLNEAMLSVAGICWPITRDAQWSGCIPAYHSAPDLKTLQHLTEGLSTGFERFPAALRRRAEEALCSSHAGSFIGLGSGLTPSYDDALVGTMAFYRAKGLPPPWDALDCTETTDVSARYLRLASEGYFGEPLCQLMEALHVQADLTAAVRQLIQVGASSGCDMLHGVLIACKTLYPNT